jgi:hypothetical protein
LAEGTYQVEFNVSGIPVQTPTNQKVENAVVSLQLTGEWADLHPVTVTTVNLSLSRFSSPDWMTVELNLNLSCPLVDLAITGVNHAYWFDFQVNYISISPSTSP